MRACELCANIETCVTRQRVPQSARASPDTWPYAAVPGIAANDDCQLTTSQTVESACMHTCGQLTRARALDATCELTNKALTRQHTNGNG